MEIELTKEQFDLLNTGLKIMYQDGVVDYELPFIFRQYNDKKKLEIIPKNDQLEDILQFLMNDVDLFDKWSRSEHTNNYVVNEFLKTSNR